MVKKSNEDIVFNLYDLNGRLISNKTFKGTGPNFSEKIDFGNLSAGIYFLNVKSGDHTYSKQLIVN